MAFNYPYNIYTNIHIHFDYLIMNIPLLSIALKRMPNVFSSNKFAEEAKNVGITQYEISRGDIASFLSSNCTRFSSKRTWHKRDINENNTIIEKVINKEEEAIIYLKSKGYKIFKTIEL